MPINDDQPYKGILPTVFKKLEPSDYKVNPFLAHKQFIFTSASATADDYIVSYASYINNLPEISSSVPTTPNWPKNIDGSYHFSVYQSINQLYYKRKEEPANVHGPSNLNRTKKHLYASASVISIPYKKLGDRVKLESFIYSGSTSYSSSFYSVSASGAWNIAGIPANGAKAGKAWTLETNAPTHSIQNTLQSHLNLVATSRFQPLSFWDGFRDQPAFIHAQYSFNGGAYQNFNMFTQSYDASANAFAAAAGASATASIDLVYKPTNAEDSTNNEFGISDPWQIQNPWDVFPQPAGTYLYKLTLYAGTTGDAMNNASFKGFSASADHFSYGPAIKSDRYSNLYDTAVSTGSFPGGETFYEGFNEYHDVSNWKYTDYKLDGGTDLKGLTDSLTAGVPYNLRETGPGESLHFLGGDYFATPIRGYYNRNYDYAISLFIKHTGVGLQNQLIAGKLNTITDPKWPFALQLNTDLEIDFSVRGATNFEAAITSSALTINEWYHVLCQKTGSSLELYIDGTKQSSGSFSLVNSQRNTPFTSSATIDNTATLKVAGYDGYSYGLRGSLDEIRIFNKSLTQAQITSLSDRNEHGGMMQTNKVGNIFADQGIAVISFPYKAFNDTLSQPYTASYQSTVQLYEHSTLVRLTAGELNVSQNPTTLQDDNINIEPWATSSLFNPYITEIGLYNEAGQMLAFGKLANPIRKRDDIDMNFLVNIDIDM
jgi:hypothetical protein